jgi:hypothetical protein
MAMIQYSPDVQDNLQAREKSIVITIHIVKINRRVVLPMIPHTKEK